MVLGSTLTLKMSTFNHSVIYPSYDIQTQLVLTGLRFKSFWIGQTDLLDRSTTLISVTKSTLSSTEERSYKASFSLQRLKRVSEWVCKRAMILWNNLLKDI